MSKWNLYRTTPQGFVKSGLMTYYKGLIISLRGYGLVVFVNITKT